jgi:ribonuclease-3
MHKELIAAKELQDRLGHRFQDPGLLLSALTHSTYAYEHRQEKIISNERLEFLGDAVLDLAVSEALYRIPVELNEGDMSKSRSLVVCENTLAALARRLRVGECLLLGKGEEATGGRDKSSNLSDAMEALFGAVYLDAGYDKACLVIQTLLSPNIKTAASGLLIHDYKSRLLELAQACPEKGKIRFTLLSEEGPVHDRRFTAGVLLDEALIGSGSGSSKKEAEQQASRQAMEYYQSAKPQDINA